MTTIEARVNEVMMKTYANSEEYNEAIKRLYSKIMIEIEHQENEIADIIDNPNPKLRGIYTDHGRCK